MCFLVEDAADDNGKSQRCGNRNVHISTIVRCRIEILEYRTGRAGSTEVAWKKLDGRYHAHHVYTDHSALLSIMSGDGLTRRISS